jgi:hypothetical protein
VEIGVNWRHSFRDQRGGHWDRGSSARFGGDAITRVKDGQEPGLRRSWNPGVILTNPLCCATFGHEPELPRAGQAQRLDLHGSHRVSACAEESGEHAERAGAPSADFKTLQPQAETAESGVNPSAVAPERVADLAAKLKHGAALAQRRLECSQNVADAVDQRTGAAEIEGARRAALAIAEAIVGAVDFAAAAAPRGVDASLLGKQLRPGGQENERRMGRLVHSGLFFQFTHGRERGRD